ncbi:hypothetical protein MIMGU_mgv1a017395mg [Erythranthe guttata]|uniref:Uncharacterized protein n=1 Tax=Erythranthe guttata TaxID=4155 RepID=A0A022Q7X6_ERYGU|nr:hypothetical protein MIMGU_mgv1a017395mg [Erythranthe guttata]
MTYCAQGGGYRYQEHEPYSPANKEINKLIHQTGLVRILKGRCNNTATMPQMAKTIHQYQLPLYSFIFGLTFETFHFI